MFRLFASIRQSLLNENKTVRYLKYAVGEIVLIMIGIFLALQLNNWNEDRKDRIEEREILRRVQVEVEAGINRMDRNLLVAKQMGESLEAVQSVIRGASMGNPFEFLVHVSLGGRMGWDQPDLAQITYTELVSAGKIGLIENIELRDQIAGFYDDIFHFEKTASLRVNEYAKVAYRLVPRGSVDGGRENDSSVKEGLAEAEYAALAEAVLESDLKHYIPGSLNRAFFLEEGWLALRDEAVALLAAIETELNQ